MSRTTVRFQRMPENPRERNFWNLLGKAKVPEETYGYVFSIVSAAVIGENPQLFGFDFDPPIPPALPEAALGRSTAPPTATQGEPKPVQPGVSPGSDSSDADSGSVTGGGADSTRAATGPPVEL